MFRFLTVAALLVASSATSIPASSRLGSRLLSTARRINNNNQNDDAADFTWVSDYSIRFDSCHTTLAFRAEGGNSADGEDQEPTESMRLVHFKLCPTDSCSASSCKNGADYLVEMREFVEAYLDFQMTQKEYNCQKVEDNCDCENANDDQACLTQCYATAGLDYCQQDEQNQYNNGNNNGNNNNAADFELDRYLECEQINEGGDDYSAALYVGAYCANNGKSIHLGTFTDRQCTKTTSTSSFSSLMGFDLPYTSESLVSNDCISCMEQPEYDDDYNADAQDADAVVEICEELYQRSAKCEGNLNHAYTQYTGGCNYINKILPQMERLAKSGSGKSASVVWAWVFAITTLLMTAYAMYLYRMLSRGKVNLSTQ
uniref:Uncharacterized protein n=1 Tax=Amphora coffeiformis TaxID=265554 RepID=A0A7S3P4R6_9STRA|eukprot:scaffold1325_cov138-Amphora_coffeaeformis.AAC.3